MGINKYFISILFLVFSASAVAGTQRVYLVNIESAKWADATKQLEFKGRLHSTKKSVNAKIKSAEIVGVVGATVCQRYQCRVVFYQDSSILFAIVSVDKNQDGNIEEKFDVAIGEVAVNGEVAFSEDTVPELVFVQERYSFIEKLTGLKDRDYFSLQLVSQ